MLDQLRLESYGFCCKMKVDSAVTLLGFAGITISIVAIIVGFLATLNGYTVIPFILIRPLFFLDSEVSSYYSIYPFIYGVFVIIIFLILLIMNIFLIQRIRADSFSEVKSVIRVICEFFLSIHLIASIFTFITSTIPHSHDPFLEVDIPLCIIGFVSIIFVCLAIHGVRKNIKGLINVYIIFNIVVVTIEIVLSIVWRSNFPAPDINDILKYDVTRILLTIVYSFYRFGLFVVLYNIMDVSVDDSQKMNSGERGGDLNMLDHIRMESYSLCCKMKVITAVSLLAWAGIIISVLAILALILLAVFYRDILLLVFQRSNFSIIDTGIVLLIPFIFLMVIIINSVLVKRSRTNSFSGVKSTLQFICKFILSIELIVLLVAMASLIIMFFDVGGYPGGFYRIDGEIRIIFIVTFLLALFLVVFVCLAIHGVRKNSKRLINAYIIFSMVMVMIEIVLSIFKRVPVAVILADVTGILPIIVYSFYHIGYFVVLYNIMEVRVENANEMRPV